MADTDGKWTPEERKAKTERRRQEMQEWARKNEKQKTDSEQPPIPFKRDCLKANEYGDGLLFAYIHKEQYVFNVDSNEWLKWQGHYWQRDGLSTVLASVENVVVQYGMLLKYIESEIHKALQESNKAAVASLEEERKKVIKRIDKLHTDKGRKAALEFAKYNQSCPLALEGDKFDSDPDLLACENGVLDLRTGAFARGRQEQYITKHCPVHWEGIDKKCPYFEKFISEVLEDNRQKIDYMQMVLGYGLTGHAVEHKFFALTGLGQNGKGVLAEILQGLAGDLAGPIPAELLLDQGRVRSSAGPSPDIMTLKGLRVAVASETDEGRKISPSAIKWLCGGDTLIGRNPHDKHTTKFRPSHTLFLLTNHRPHAPADDFAFWQRVILINFNVSFVDREPETPNERRADKDLKNKLMKEAPGILAWIVWGALLWRQHGLQPPPAVRDDTIQYREDEDILGDFLSDECLTGPSLSENFAALYERFCSWHELNISKRTPSRKRFGNWLSRRFERKKTNIIKYIGLKLKES